MGQFHLLFTRTKMDSKLVLLLIIGSVMAFEIEVAQNEDIFDRTLCCLTANAQSKCATACASQDCAASCTVRCGILSSVCATYVCSAVASSTCTTTTTTTAATATTCVGGGRAGRGGGTACCSGTCTASATPGTSYCLG